MKTTAKILSQNQRTSSLRVLSLPKQDCAIETNVAAKPSLDGEGLQPRHQSHVQAILDDFNYIHRQCIAPSQRV